jgi:O-antigen ligase
MIAVGLSGLLMSRSLGSTAAAVLALGVFGVQAVRTRRRGPNQQLVVPTRLLVLVCIGLAVAGALRPTNLPSSSSFGRSTTVHRVILADAGLELFAEHPVLGVGWQRAPEEIAAPSITDALHARYGSFANPEFIPSADSTTEVHNSYVQVLAESGLVGFSVLIALLFIMGRGIALVLRSVRSNPRLYVAGRAAVVLLVVTLIWWNDNTLYGAQPESVLAATYLGVLAAVPGVALRNRGSVTVAD